ncbi:hypothetical protein [Deinococcus multiflagellatus]|uniref:ParB/Sulfiredoxin domain-containing protein n=1 Tax=Deinococcus multiflagellatus TaxID=1656887 RepID=A0ABW1ZP54_9DEIO|nr:hypothetical protein [Deinococcus multiflagellatus]MBZ9712672.1 hypothetical protein [Deinococcus multiflagellatus]
MTAGEFFTVPGLQPAEIGAWVDTWLRQPGGNLGLAPRQWEGPLPVAITALRRACGPEPGMEYPEPAERWTARLDALMQAHQRGARFAPLIVQRRGDVLSVRDGNHRLGALEQLGGTEAWVVIWSDGVG